MAAFDHIALDLHIFPGKLRRRRIVGVDASHLCRGEHHRVRPLFLKKGPDSGLVAQIQFFMRPSDDILIPFFFRLRTMALPTSPRWPAT